MPEIADILRTTPAYVRRELIGKNRIRHIRITKKMIRVPLSAVAEFLAGDSGVKHDRNSPKTTSAHSHSERGPA